MNGGLVSPMRPNSPTSRSRPQAIAVSCRLNAATTSSTGGWGRGSAIRRGGEVVRWCGGEKHHPTTSLHHQPTTSSQLLLLQHFIQPLFVFLVERDRRVALVVDLRCKTAQVVAAGEGDVQIEDVVAIVGSQRQAEARQLLLQRRRVDLV